MQTRKQTAIEVAVNVIIGSIGAWLITYATLKWVAGDAQIATVSLLGCTLWSILRQYAIRRYFNKIWR